MKKGFTLIEILIVVVLAGIICAVAVPLVNQHRATRAQAVMQDDGARLGIAAQAYFAETFSHEVTIGYDTKTGRIDAPDAFKMLNGNRIEPGYEIEGGKLTIERDTDKGFKLTSPVGGVYTFNYKGALTKSQPYVGETGN